VAAVILLAHAAGAWLREALVAAMLCLGELLLLSYDCPSRRFECRALSYDVDRGQSSVLQDASIE
jgi:hypothetical protein